MKKILKRIMSHNEIGAVLPLISLLVLVWFVNGDAFFGATNIFDILRTASFSFIAAVPITFLMSSGGMDLSIGASTSLGGVVCAFAMKAGIPILPSILIAIISTSVVGALNGVIVVKYAMPPFIATLGMQYVVNGLIAISTNNIAIANLPRNFMPIAQTRLFGVVTMPVLYATVIGVIGFVILKFTKFGREVLAIGGNRETAYLAGINVIRRRIAVYTAVGACAGFSGILMAARMASAQPASGTGTEMTIMASCIIGGTSTYGGQGTVLGSALGCILLAVIRNALIMMGVSVNWQNFVFGLILLIALFVDMARQKASAGD
ncbi:MAG: ABC transporter permease [Clostridiales bacterium]|nr:ABC transporter permease [Clostridiales bacterium]